MPFEKGQSGNPGGQRKEKDFANALRVAVNEEHDDQGVKKKKLRMIAERLVREAMCGEGWAIQQVADRLDGKVPQGIENGENGDFAITLSWLK